MGVTCVGSTIWLTAIGKQASGVLAQEGPSFIIVDSFLVPLQFNPESLGSIHLLLARSGLEEYD